MIFRVDDEVEWTSQAGGCAKTKRGKVVCVVRAGASPKAALSFGLHVPLEVAQSSLPRTVGAARDHDSYLIQVGRQRRLWWPAVKNLTPFNQEVAQQRIGARRDVLLKIRQHTACSHDLIENMHQADRSTSDFQLVARHLRDLQALLKQLEAKHGQ